MYLVLCAGGIAGILARTQHLRPADILLKAVLSLSYSPSVSGKHANVATADVGVAALHTSIHDRTGRSHACVLRGKTKCPVFHSEFRTGRHSCESGAESSVLTLLCIARWLLCGAYGTALCGPGGRIRDPVVLLRVASEINATTVLSQVSCVGDKGGGLQISMHAMSGGGNSPLSGHRCGTL